MKGKIEALDERRKRAATPCQPRETRLRAKTASQKNKGTSKLIPASGGKHERFGETPTIQNPDSFEEDHYEDSYDSRSFVSNGARCSGGVGATDRLGGLSELVRYRGGERHVGERQRGLLRNPHRHRAV